MPARVAAGNVGGVFRFVVSKPGVDVLTAGLGGLMFDSSRTHLRLIQTGSFTIGASQTVNIAVSGATQFQSFLYFSFPAPQNSLWQPVSTGITYNFNGTLASFTRANAATTGSTPITVRYSIWGW